jgi:acyl-CoA thioesterase FadM
MRVHWVDTDAGGRIHHTAVFRWAELVEHNLYRVASLGRVDNLPRRHVEATYHLPLAFDDEFDFSLGVERIGSTSVVYAWQAERGGAVCVTGRTVVIHVDDSGKPAHLPRALRATLAAHIIGDGHG